MISRRNIRIKVMQTIYTMHTYEKDVIPDEPKKILKKHFENTLSLFTYLVYFLTELTRYAEKDANQKALKHLPTASDLSINTKIAGNDILVKMLNDPELKKQFEKEKTAAICDRELLKKIYNALVETAEYKAYITHPERDPREEKKVIEFILNDMMLANELFVSHVEEYHTNWDDDGEMIVQLVAGYIQKPGSYNFNKWLSEEKKLFAENLLQTVLEKTEYLQSLIKPKLKNWDSDRIAHLDMILMKMGVAEFLYFETIPPKVTINEYIDLAKDYSTSQSGQFVNGILDNIHKELMQEGKMKKVEYRKT